MQVYQTLLLLRERGSGSETTKNGEFKGPRKQIFDAKELCKGFILDVVDYKLLELFTAVFRGHLAIN